MGCNCKVKSNIINLHKKYGQTVNYNFKEILRFYIIEGLKRIGMYAIIIPILPFIIGYIIIELIRGKGILNLDAMLKKIHGK